MTKSVLQRNFPLKKVELDLAQVLNLPHGLVLQEVKLFPVSKQPRNARLQLLQPVSELVLAKVVLQPTQITDDPAKVSLSDLLSLVLPWVGPYGFRFLPDLSLPAWHFTLRMAFSYLLLQTLYFEFAERSF